MPLSRRILAARGMPTNSLTWWCSKPRSSRIPTAAISVAPVRMPQTCARAGLPQETAPPRERRRRWQVHLEEEWVANELCEDQDGPPYRHEEPGREPAP